MKKVKLYRYIGRNGAVTTYVLLDGINHTPIYQLTADEGKALTNGEQVCHTVSVYAEYVDNWKEIDAPEANLDK